MRTLRRAGAMLSCLAWLAARAHAADPAAIGVAMPNTIETRWLRDAAALSADLRQLGYRPDARNAGNDVTAQIAQVRDMIADGDRALIIAAVNDGALAGVLAEAAQRHLPVIAYDRLIRGTPDVNFYVSFDNWQVGVQQARSLLQGLGFPAAQGPFTLELFAGSPDDANAYRVFDGAMSVLRPLIASGVLVVGSGQTKMTDASTLRWSADAAHARLDNLLAAFYVGRHLDAVLAPNDELAGGIISSLHEAGYGPKGARMAIVTGQDCELEAVRAIVAGAQYSSVFKDTRALAKSAADMVNAVLAGSAPEVNTQPGPDNGARHVPSNLLAPVTVDRKNVEQILIGAGYYTRAEIY